MGKKSRDKGSRTERAIVHALQDNGLAAEKISGMYKSGADISVPVLGIDRDIEVCRVAIFTLGDALHRGAKAVGNAEIDLPDSGWDRPEGDGWEQVGNYADANGDFWIRWVRLTWPGEEAERSTKITSPFFDYPINPNSIGAIQ
jgi:hypothetical protein